MKQTVYADVLLAVNFFINYFLLIFSRFKIFVSYKDSSINR